MTLKAEFHVGQLVHHKLFGYRGVVIDVDPYFNGTDEWYSVMAKSKPPKDRPWYHILVDQADYRTYVAERNLEPDTEGGPVRHPDLDNYFGGMDGGAYKPRAQAN